MASTQNETGTKTEADNESPTGNTSASAANSAEEEDQKQVEADLSVAAAAVDPLAGFSAEERKQQEECIMEMRRLLPSAIKQAGLAIDPNTDFSAPDLTRFAVARNCDCAKAMDMFLYYLDWFEKARPDQVTHDQIHINLGFESLWFQKTDRFNRPVMWSKVAKYDAYKREVEMTNKYTGWLLWNASEMAVKNGVSQYVMVMDLAGFGYKNMDTECVKSGVTILDKCFPERVGAIICINVPTLFWIFWKVISPFVPQRTRQKIMFLRSEKEWKPVIEKLMPAEHIPREYGGADDWEFRYQPDKPTNEWPFVNAS